MSPSHNVELHDIRDIRGGGPPRPPAPQQLRLLDARSSFRARVDLEQRAPSPTEIGGHDSSDADDSSSDSESVS